MKAKITLFIGAVALVTLSFTFTTAEKQAPVSVISDHQVSTPVGGIIADEVVK